VSAQARPFDIVAVETNWVLDVALHQDEGSEELLTQAQQGVVQLLLPSICIAEAIKRFESIRQSWIDLERSIRNTVREIMRSSQLRFAEARLVPAIETLTEVSAIAEREFWRVLELVTGLTQLIEPQPATVGLTADIRSFLNLQPPDASVLATIVTSSRAGTCRKFMSRDSDFRTDDVLAYMRDEGLEYFDSAYPIVGPLRQHMPPG
jgi:predicted nucleic acid-binding protein